MNRYCIVPGLEKLCLLMTMTLNQLFFKLFKSLLLPFFNSSTNKFPPLWFLELLETRDDNRCSGTTKRDCWWLLADDIPKKGQGYCDVDGVKKWRPGLCFEEWHVRKSLTMSCHFPFLDSSFIAVFFTFWYLCDTVHLISIPGAIVRLVPLTYVWVLTFFHSLDGGREGLTWCKVIPFCICPIFIWQNPLSSLDEYIFVQNF